MSKLIFCYGAMGASKSAELLMWAHNYEKAGKCVQLFKPEIDTRDKEIIKSRIGLSRGCVLIKEKDQIGDLLSGSPHIIMIDEAQFLTKEQVDQLYDISNQNITVICFGLRTDFKQEFFEGSRRLMELATDIRELKTVCSCGKKATINARFQNGDLVTDGPQIMVGDEEYKAMCKDCYEKEKKHKHHLRYEGTDFIGDVSINIYKCKDCGKEFI